MKINSKEELLIYKAITGIQRMYVKGGAFWLVIGDECRSAHHDNYHGNLLDDTMGFRILKEPT